MNRSRWVGTPGDPLPYPRLTPSTLTAVTRSEYRDDEPAEPVAPVIPFGFSAPTRKEPARARRRRARADS